MHILYLYGKGCYILLLLLTMLLHYLGLHHPSYTWHYTSSVHPEFLVSPSTTDQTLPPHCDWNRLLPPSSYFFLFCISLLLFISYKPFFSFASTEFFLACVPYPSWITSIVVSLVITLLYLFQDYCPGVSSQLNLI